MKLSGFALALLLASSVTVEADTLLVDAVGEAPPNSVQGVPRPVRGARMGEVTTGYGEPTGVMDAVGDPPITRWVYPDYTVYFEYDRVIDVVVHR
jgi:hypothetical protein